MRLEVPEDEVTLYAAARLDGNEVVVIGRRGGPEFADSRSRGSATSAASPTRSRPPTTEPAQSPRGLSRNTDLPVGLPWYDA